MTSALAEQTAEVQALSNGLEGNGKRLTMRAMSLILQLSEAGKTQTEIAQVVGCSVPTVSRTLDNLTDNRALARRQLEAAAPRLAKTITQSKDAATALRTLQKLDVVRDESDRAGVGVLVVVGTPDTPLRPPDIVVSPAKVIEGSAKGAETLAI